LRRLDDHLQREFHPRASQIQPVVQAAGESAHATITVADARVEKNIEQCGEAGIPEVFVEPRHRPGLDAAAKAVTHHDVMAFTEFFNESGHFREVVAVVRIAHDDEWAARSGDAGAQGGAVTALGHANHSRAVLFRNLNRTVCRAVVGNDDFAGKARGAKRLHRFVQTERKGLRFIQAGNDHRHFDRLRCIGSGRLRSL